MLFGIDILHVVVVAVVIGSSGAGAWYFVPWVARGRKGRS